MRIWSIHPEFLDSKGLVALWRETLLAQKVLQGNTKGYKNHPQLDRFKKTDSPLHFIGRYLIHIWKEADRRGYSFDYSKIKNNLPIRSRKKIKVTAGQLAYEIKHLRNKLEIRDLNYYEKLQSASTLSLHPLFRLVPGEIEDWEITN